MSPTISHPGCRADLVVSHLEALTVLAAIITQSYVQTPNQFQLELKHGAPGALRGPSVPRAAPGFARAVKSSLVRSLWAHCDGVLDGCPHSDVPIDSLAYMAEHRPCFPLQGCSACGSRNVHDWNVSEQKVPVSPVQSYRLGEHHRVRALSKANRINLGLRVKWLQHGGHMMSTEPRQLQRLLDSNHILNRMSAEKYQQQIPAKPPTLLGTSGAGVK
ncbi:unnamed protein product [Pleuronectes platessa]|uniref:Uncharacterized protein n=1 Tax=Pleuronectes platessa TaxID=8262 RepID=A0A9N7YME3_PLEPL|nr:unnamed protein product [Pleuronectes platessa]